MPSVALPSVVYVLFSYGMGCVLFLFVSGRVLGISEMSGFDGKDATTTATAAAQQQ